MQATQATQTLDFDDIQGIVLYGYGRLPFVRYVFLSIEDADRARAWLELAAGEVTSARTVKSPGAATTLHLAFTVDGLRALGFAEDELTTFPTAFTQGMTAPYRSRLLGDYAANDPDNWQFGGPKTPTIHALLILYAHTEEAVEALTTSQTQRLEGVGGISVIRVEGGYLKDDRKEHFGFKDGISQPKIQGSGRTESDGEAPIKTGEFLLGYENEYGELPSSPTVPNALDSNGDLHGDPSDSGRRDLGRNGTYLVYRKLSQDVEGFWKFADEHSKKEDGQSDPEAAKHLGARIVGRWPGGAPLVLSPSWDNPKFSDANVFNYTHMDPKSHACPAGSHIRRANPRDALPPDSEESLRETRRHRLMRRGRIYGPSLADGEPQGGEVADRGFQFIVINADLHRQFEFVQQTWINSPKFDGLYRDPDPLTGVHPHNGGRCLTIQGEPVRRQIARMPSFVTVKGGAYFFLPSLRGIRFLAQGGYAKPLRPIDASSIPGRE
ncbi:MAG TPA: hypothetical protein VL242_39615 [Sorangium sp.]|nr:hypothetical protein [Sorangium sp.]